MQHLRTQLVDAFRLYHSPKSIRQFRQNYGDEIRCFRSRNISVSNSIFGQKNIISSLSSLSSRRANTDMRHVPGQYKLIPASPLQVFLEIGTSEGTWLLLVDELFAALGFQLCELFSKIGVGREDWCSRWSVVDDMNERGIGCAVFL